MSEKVQLNIKVEKETKEIIERESERIGGSKRFQGQYVDRVIQNEGDNSKAILERLDRIEDELVDIETIEKSRPQETQTELEQKVEQGEPIDPSKHDLTQMKGSGQAMEAAELIVQHEKGMTEKEIEELFSSRFDYSVNAARQKRKALMGRLNSTQIIDGEELRQRLEEEMDEWSWHKKIETGNNTISPHKNIDDKRGWFLETHEGGVNEFVTQKVKTDLSAKYVTDERHKTALEILESRLDHIREDLDDELVRDRVAFLQSTVQDQILDIEELEN